MIASDHFHARAQHVLAFDRKRVWESTDLALCDTADQTSTWSGLFEFVSQAGLAAYNTSVLRRGCKKLDSAACFDGCTFSIWTVSGERRACDMFVELVWLCRRAHLGRVHARVAMIPGIGLLVIQSAGHGLSEIVQSCSSEAFM